jgi:thioredoxin-like negative regulator of GroEL
VSLRRALAIQPGHEEARINLADALGALGRTTEAVAELEAVLAAHPDLAYASERLDYWRQRMR